MSGSSKTIEVRLFTSPAPFIGSRVVSLLEGIRNGSVRSITQEIVTVPVNAMDGPLLVRLYAKDDLMDVTHFSSEELMREVCQGSDLVFSSVIDRQVL